MKKVFSWKLFFGGVLILLWFCAHYFGVVYGTSGVPLHTIYVGDEQSPIYGALHVLEKKSLLGLRNENVLYYGPFFALLAPPAIVGDFAYQFLFEDVRSAVDYKNVLIFDWGGVLIGARVISVLLSFLGLFVLYKIFLLKSINSSQNKILAFLGAGLIGVNFYYFEYSHFFKHWVFVFLAFIVQVYIALLMYSSKGRVWWHWYVHGAMTVLIFGISYVGVIYEIAFLPLLYVLFKEGKEMRKRILWYMLGVCLSCALVIAWHPYGFVRYLGFLNIGPMTGKLGTIGVTENPLAFKEMSFGYYTRLIVYNHVTLLFGGILLAYYFFKKKAKEGWEWAWMFLSAGGVNYIFFSLTEHHEGRYMLPTVILLIASTAVLFIRFFHERDRSKKLFQCISVLFIFYGVFHIVHDARWMYIWSTGTPEDAIIKQVKEYQKVGEEPILVLDNGILGAPHTRESYEKYIEYTKREGYTLFRTILNTPPPKDRVLLNVRYARYEEYLHNPSEYRDARHVLRATYGDWSQGLNQFDYFDENILRVWYDHAAYLPWYEIIK